MKNKNLQAGFAPLLVIAIVAVLAIGGGAYVVSKNKQAKNAELEDNLETQANANADANANANANLGINAKGSLRSLLGLGKNTMCTFSSTMGDITSSGTVYVSADGGMRGDFTSETKAGTQTSSMIVKGDTSYVWSGSQGMKMNVEGSAGAGASAETKSNVDLDSQVDYECKNWSVDQSKFNVPSSVKFMDIEAMMKSSGGVDINALMKAQGQ
jgi:hypothetical protein